MREIKLRAWLVTVDWETEKEKPGRMIYFGGMTYCDEYNHIGFNLAKESRDPDGGDYGNLAVSTDNLKDVMLFTGLRDKNGREIFEGDIVSVPTAAGQIPCDMRWDLGVGAWEAVAEQRELFYLGDEISGCEVIGNRWENPELLGGAERD